MLSMYNSSIMHFLNTNCSYKLDSGNAQGDYRTDISMSFIPDGKLF